MASEPRYVALPELFQGRLFRVPDYQRGYAWTEQQLDDLWTDIELLDDKTQHFTGMIVVEKRGRERKGLEAFDVMEVIDGQQRLTTLVLLLQALVQEMEGSDDEEAAQEAAKLRERYLRSRGGWTLLLNEDSRAYFVHLLEDGEPPVRIENGSQQNILNAVHYLRGRIQDFGESSPERLPQVYSLVARLQSDLRFVYYEVDDDAEAGLIFEVMNNRGKELSQADRLKNYLMYLAHKVNLPADDVRGVAQSWGELFKQVMLSSPDGVSSPEAESRLLRNHWWLYKESKFPKEYSGYSISQRVRQEMLLEPVPDEEVAERDERLASDLRAYTRSLVRTSYHFAEVFNPGAPEALSWVRDQRVRADLRRVLSSFHQMGHTATAVPLLLAGRHRLEKRPDVYLDLATALSIYSFRLYAICNCRSHTGQAHFRRQGRRLFSAADEEVEAVIRSIVGDLYAWAEDYGSDAALRIDLGSSNFYEAHRPQEIRYFFYEYERHLCGGQTPQLDWATFANSKETQVEHIWARAVQWLGGDADSHERNVNRLGNLTVTHFNQRLGKQAFKDKKPIYARSNLLIENELQHFPDWGMDQIKSRQTALIEFALQRWPLPSSGS